MPLEITRAMVEAAQDALRSSAGAVLSRESVREALAAALAGETGDPIVKLCAKIDADIRRCDHGYIHVSCGQCMAAWLPRP